MDENTRTEASVVPRDEEYVLGGNILKKRLILLFACIVFLGCIGLTYKGSTSRQLTADQILNFKGYSRRDIPNFLLNGITPISFTNGRFDYPVSGCILNGAEVSLDVAKKEGGDCEFAFAEVEKSSITTGDVNGDGVLDAVAVLGYSGGGSGYFENLSVFLNDAGKPKFVASTDLGDRTVIQKIEVLKGKIYVDMLDHGVGEGLSSATEQEHRVYELRGGNLVRDDI